MKPTFFLLLATFFWSSVQAQTITGAVQTTGGAAAEFATVMLYNARDTVLVKGAITDENGRYMLDGPAAGRYFIKAALVGAGNVWSPVFDYDGGEKILETLQLTNDAQTLAEVTVVARKPIVEVKADKTIFNVEGNVNAQGQNALELLRKAPGVTVDNNDNVSIKGKNAVRFQIDGRDVPLDSKELVAQLKGMRAEDIAAIEMITNPSAKYDASGNAGIINFKTKKNKNLGTNGSVGLELIYGESMKSGANLSFNHRNRGMNVFGSYSNHFGDWHNDLSLLRDQQGAQPDPGKPGYDPDRRYLQKSFMTDNNNNHNYKFGTDFFLNSKHTVGFIVDGRHAHGPWQNESRTVISPIETPDQVEKILVARNHQPQYRDNFNANVNYRYADTSGHELTIDVNRGLYRYRANAFQPNYYYDASEQTILSENVYRNNTPTDIDLTIVKADYEQNLWKGKFGVGLKLNNVATDNTFDFFKMVDGQPLPDSSRSNRFVYKEMVNAGYVNYNIQLKKWSLQAGVRAEYTDWKGELTTLKQGGDEMPSDHYLDWFPSAAVSYAMNEKNQFSLSYSRRIDRPSYRDLNPFEDKLDELTYKKGNPFLRPQFTNSIELSHTYLGFLNTSLGYSHTNDLFTEYIDTASAGAAYQRQGNIAQQDNFSLSVSCPLPIAKWWEGYINFTGVISAFEANFRPGFAYEASFKSLNVYSEHNFRLPKGWSIQLSGWYNSPSIWQATFRSRAMGSLDAGIKKQLFHGKGAVQVRVGDLLNTNHFSMVNDFTPGLYMTGAGHWESQTVQVNLNYQFGNRNVKNSRRRETGIEDVNARIKTKN